ncbi:hypothetical protein Ahy_B01g055639 [Arachis hypogaea]|uniref:Aminotransferase-like plant mobile domain-containing protein n=1 Tax=Arachis hypogaea TaxID=3818 RepID=A0A445AWP2_ARAHY|nr:hypothetical protein Ahy_B01g055639 [Arachis hypogaea]
MASSSSHTAQDKGKDDETHCFVGPIDNLEMANKQLHLFPIAQGEDLLINQDLDISFFTTPKTSFRNNPKITPEGLTLWLGTNVSRQRKALPVVLLEFKISSEFIAHHMGADNEPVTDDEHLVFLFYWLNAIVFCSRNVQMHKLFHPLTALLHEGKNFNLAKLLLGHIFEEVVQFVNCLRNNFLISTGGPLWLLQL